MSSEAPGTKRPELSAEKRAMLEARLKGQHRPSGPARPVHTGPVPLSFAQERLWFLYRLQPENPFYNVPSVFWLGGVLDTAALERALNEVVRRHETLRTTFTEVDGVPAQVVAPFHGLAVPVEDLSGLPEAERDGEMRRRVDAEVVRPFDLEAGPVFRPVLLRLGARDHVLLLCMHHILSDDWSMQVLQREVSALYHAYREGRESPLPELPVQYRDYAVLQREQLRGAVLERHLGYWRERLAGAPAVLELPADRPRPPVQTYRGTSEEAALSPALLDRLHALGRGEGATLFMVLLAAFQVLLARYAGTDDVVVGSPVAGRPRKELQGLVGFFLNTLVLRTELAGDPSFRAVVGRVREGTLGAFEHQEMPFEKLVEELQPGRSLSHSPLFQVMFVLGDTDGARPAVPAGDRGDGGDGARRSVDPRIGTSKFDLTLSMAPRPAGLTATLEYNTDLFERATIRRMLGHLERVLEQVASNPDVRLSALDLLDDAERRQVVRGWNATEAAYPSGLPVHALFEAQADRTPDAPAVITRDGESLTYAELDARANRLANHLVRRGVQPDDRVALCLERGAEMMAAVLGILKAGAAYVPLDPAYPAERRAYMLADSGARVLVTQSCLESPPSFSTSTSSAALVVRVDGDAEAIGRESAGRPRVPVGPEHLAYVIYTSGSTGRPKGVAMPHRPLVNLLAWQQREWMHPSASATLQFTTLSFDVSFQEIFSCWVGGGRLVLVGEDERRDLGAVLQRLDEERIERIFLPYVALQHLAEAADERAIVPRALREVQTAGEQLRVTEPIRRFFTATGATLSNHYGPSETHVVTALRLEGAPDAWPLLPAIGAPIANTQCYVLDAGFRPSPIGIPGELFLGGENVARGYLGRPALTAERFVPDPFAARAGARVYRTGDRARWRADGTLAYLGRTDEQVKIRGFRIEPGEVEAVLAAHDAVREAVVVVREDVPGDRRLVGYVVPAEGAAPASAELRAHLKGRLPEYMVPAAVVVLDAIPLTPSGKVARRALPAPDGALSGAEYVAPRTATEEILAGIYADVLRVERVGVSASFFDLGGHSLLATRIVSRIRDALGIEVPLRALFEGPTVAELARAADALAHAGRGLAVPPVVPVPRDGPLPLSYSQERLWVLQQLSPGSGAYNLGAPLRLSGPLDVSALERSLAAIVRRHEALRTRFVAVDGAPVQVIDPPGDVRIPVVDLSALGADVREAAMRALARDETQRPFDLAAGPLLRSTLVRLAPGEHALFFIMHHAVSDGWSLSVLVREVSELYAGFCAGREAPLPPLPVQYADYAVWQRGWLTGEVLEAQLAYWRGALADVPALELPLDRPRPAVQTYRGAGEPLVLPAPLSDALRALGRREGATLFMTLVAALQLLLSRLSGQEDFAVGSPVAGRTRGETEGLIGCFLNNLVLRADLRGDPSFRALLGRVREVTLGAYAHQDVPFEKLIDALRPPRDPARTPFFQVLANLLPGDDGARLRLGDVVAEGLDGGAPQAKFDLSLYITDGAEIAVWLVYNADLFDAATVRAMLASWQVLLESAVEAPERRISTIPLLRPEERGRLAAAVHHPRPAVPFAPFAEPAPGESIADRFAARVRAAPDAVAVETGLHRWTYAELDGRAGRVAAALLRACGAGPARVALFLDHDAPMLAGVLGTLRAGKTYVPLDPAGPPERARTILADVEPAALLAEAAHAETVRTLAGTIPVLVLEEIFAAGPADSAETAETADLPDLADESASADSAETVAVEIDPDAPAYILYTSGSTGTPKGVVQSHRNVLRHIRTYANRLHLGPGDRLSLFAAYGFDAAVMDIYGALLTGATLCPIALRGEAGGDLPGEVARRGITVFHSTPTVYRHLAAQLGGAHDLSAIRLVVLGGEEAVPHDLALFRRHFAPDALFVNGMGPTECTVALQFFADADTDLSRGAMPVGHAVEDVEVRLLNADGDPVETWATGEVTVRAAHVALGYWRRPELTEAAFLPDPDGGARRIYRTGDFGRLLPDGSIAFAGRRDGQVKIRGFRVETGEVESVLHADPRVRECAVVARTDGGEARLVAYVVAAEDAHPTAVELRAGARERLPEHMVPSAFVSIDALPLTPNGKLDRRALPAPPAKADGETGAYVAPRTQAEELLAGIFADVLRVDRVGVETSFFDLGGHSLLATRVVSRVRDVLGVELPLRAVFEQPAVAQLAGVVEALRREGSAQLPAIVPVERTGPLPLSFAQERLWFLDRLQPGSAAYVMPAALRLTGALDVAALERALGETVRRHEALRTVFAEADGAPVQTVLPFDGFALPVEDLSALPDAEREAAARRRTMDEAGRPFDLAAGPLFRGVLLRLAEDEHVLLLALHHIAGDGWSMGVLYRELTALYAAFAAGAESPLAPLPVQYADAAVWQRAQLRGEVLERQLAWWKERLAGAPEVLELPTDRPRSAVRTQRGGMVAAMLPAEVLQRLNAFARGEGATLYMVLLAAFQALLSRYGGGDDVVVGTPIAGRTRRETEGLIGLFVNTLVMRTDLGGDPPFRELVRRVRDVTLGAYEHQEVPFEQLVAELQPERSLSHSPLFQVMFTLNEAGGEPATALPGLTIRGMEGAKQTTKFDLTLTCSRGGDGLQTLLEYNAGLFDHETVERMLHHLGRLVAQVAEDPERRLSDVELLTETERDAVLREWNGTDRPYPLEIGIHRLVEAQVARTPDAVALVHEGARITYAALNASANRLAHALRDRGMGRGTFVPVLAERGPHVAVAMLAAMKAGAAFVPLDARWPEERLRRVLDDLRAPLLLAGTGTDALAAALGVPVIPVEIGGEIGGEVGGYDAPNPESGTGPDDPIYAIYTSGSTGVPKGAVVPHGGIANRFHWMTETFGAGSARCVLQTTRHVYDSAVWQLFWPLTVGGRTVIPRPDGETDADYLVELIRTEGVTMTDFVPSVFNALVPELAADASARERLASLRTVIVGGEQITAETTYRFMDLFPGIGVVNLYGPTECSIGSIHHPVSPADGGRIPIGRPIANTSALILDRGGRLVPQRIPGEIHLGGRCVGLGYIGDGGRTSAVFIPNPYAPHGGERLYRTGDLGRYRADGSIECLGRLDEQVKIRGFRIEPGEIQAALLQVPGVRDALVVAAEASPGERRLVAYVAAGEPDAFPPAMLRAHLAARLPDYMVPAAFVVLAGFPLTPNGKVDRRALPAPAWDAGRAYAAPRTPAEEMLAEIWAEVLGVERVGVHDGFFELGGHSLLATRVISRVRRAFGAEVPLRALFEHPTVAGLAPRVQAALSADGDVRPLPLRRVPRDGHPAASFGQERMWAAHRANPAGTSFNLHYGLRVHGPLDAAVLERALTELVRRHETLRTTFREQEGGVVQVIHPPAPVRVPVADLRGAHGAAHEQAVQALSAEQAGHPFDLERGPLLRTLLVRTGEAEHAFLFTLHHVVTDGWSTGVLVRELSALYAAYAAGREPALAEPEVQYADYAAWQRAWLSGAVLDEQLAYWTAQLAGAPRLALPTDRPRVPGARGWAAAHPFELEAELSDAVRVLARREGCTLYMALLAAFQALLARTAGQDDLCIGTPIAGRMQRETEGLIGFFTNTLVIRADLSGAPDFRTLLGRVREATLAAYGHQDLPYARLVTALRPESGAEEMPLFQVVFELEHARAAADALRLPGVQVSPLPPSPLAKMTLRSEMRLTMTDAGSRIGGSLAYRTELFDASTIDGMVRGYLALLRDAALAPDRPPRDSRRLAGPVGAG